MAHTPQNGRHATTLPTTSPVTTALLRRRTNELERHLPLAIAGQVEGVHQARVASRRLREAVPVLTVACKARRKAERKIRRFTQALGTVRELDVTIQILDEFARGGAVPRSALEDVRAHVVGERERRRAEMLARLRRVRVDKIRRRLQQAAILTALSPAADWRRDLGTRITRRGGRLQEAIKAAGQIYAEEPLHGVRIAAKKLRYALELAVDGKVTTARPLISTLKRAQDTLGRLHDLQIIAQHVAAVQALPPARRGARDRGLDVIAARLGEECRHLHARYVKQVPVLLELTERCATLIVPTAPVPRGRVHKLAPRRSFPAPVARRA